MDRPKVVVYNVASVDGRLAISRDRMLLYGDERWDSIDVAGEFDVYQWLLSQHQPQATLEGSGSFVVDDEQPAPLPPYSGDPALLYDDFLPESIVKRPGHRGWFTAVDGRGRVRWAYKAGDAWPGFEGWYALVLAARNTPPAYLAYLRREEIPYLVAGEARVDLALALAKMKAQLGVGCVLSTAGGRLNGALLRSGLVDEIDVVFNPAIIGSAGAPTLFAAPDLGPSEMPVKLSLVSAQAQAGGRVWLRYRVMREGDSPSPSG